MMHYLVNYLCDLPPGKQLLLKVFFTWAFWNCISHLYKCVFDALTFHVQKLTQGTISKQKVKFLSKKSILTKLYNFLGKSKLSTTKKCKTTTFSRVFHPKKIDIFSRNQSWIFGQKLKISNSVALTHLLLTFKNWRQEWTKETSFMILKQWLFFRTEWFNECWFPGRVTWDFGWCLAATKTFVGSFSAARQQHQ